MRVVPSVPAISILPSNGSPSGAGTPGWARDGVASQDTDSRPVRPTGSREAFRGEETAAAERPPIDGRGKRRVARGQERGDLRRGRRRRGRGRPGLRPGGGEGLPG